MKEEPISASGSNRQYVRITTDSGEQYIRVRGTSKEENHAFIGMARHFRAQGLPVPEILSVSEDEMEYTQEDLGNTLLFDYIKKGRLTGVFSEEEKTMLRRVMRLLAHFQVEGARGMDWSLCYPISSFNREAVLWDLNYFKYCFLKGTKIEFSEPKLEDDFDAITSYILHQPSDTFLYRDFQSRNVIIKDGQPYFIDFQGGRKGPTQYDVASFLWQAKANFSPELREKLIDAYLDELAVTGYRLQVTEWKAALPHFVLLRTLQVLGAYGYRGYFERKPHFLESIPLALKNLREIFETNPDLQTQYPYLYALSNDLLLLV